MTEPDNFSAEALVHWLRAKYRRHGELEDEKAADLIERLEELLGKVWDIARDNNLQYRARVEEIMSTIREKPVAPSENSGLAHRIEKAQESRDARPPWLKTGPDVTE